MRSRSWATPAVVRRTALWSFVPVVAVLSACGTSPADPGNPVASVEVAPPVGQLVVGDTVRFLAVARAAGGSELRGHVFSWSTDRADLVTVDQTGLVTGMAAGTAKVTAATSGMSGDAQIAVAEVPPVPVDSVPVTPVITSLSPATIQAGWGNFTLTVIGEGFVPQSRVLWSGVPLESFFVSSTELSATVSSAYVALEGTSEVTVETPVPTSTTSNAVTFTIFSQPALTIELQIAGNAVFVGNRIRLTAVARNQFGEVIPGKAIEWTSGDTAVAKIDGEYLIGLKQGAVNVRADATPTSTGTTLFVLASPVSEVIFQASLPGGPELFVRPLDPVGGVRRFLPPGTYAREPSPSPDGTKVAFVGRDAFGNEDIYVANRDGTGQVRLTTADAMDSQPAWSPDGLSIAFRSLRQGKSDIWLMDADGSNQRNLTYASVFLPEEFNDHPSWSPDSQTLLFSRGFGVGQSLFKIGADGTGLTAFLAWPNLDLLEPAWSPDGSYIAVHRYDRALGQSGVEIVGSETGTPVYFSPVAPSGARSPAWLPGGWMAVIAPALPTSTAETVALVRPSFNQVVVPMGEEYGPLEGPAGLP